MNKFFYPNSIAVIGVSRNKKKVGRTIFENLIKYHKVFPVNLRAKKIGKHKCYNSVLNIKQKIDLAIVVVPSKFVPNVLEDCGKKKIKNVVIISAGFSEVGNYDLRDKVKKIIYKYRINVIGPNCLGIINTDNLLNASFYEYIPKKGNIAFVTQSGAVGTAILDKVISEGIGISKFISVGNMLDLSFYNYFNYLCKDKKTKVIIVYLESLKNALGFVRACKKCKKPIIILKAGRTKSGLEAAKTHTNALAKDIKVYEGIFNQSKNVILVDNIKKMFDLAKIISYQNLPKGKFLIVTNAGGGGILAADALSDKLLTLNKKVIKELSRILPSNWSKRNPIDIVGDADPERYKKTLDLISKLKFNNLLVILTPQTMTKPLSVAKVLVNWKKKNKGKNLITCFMGGKSVKKAIDYLEKNNIPNLSEPYFIKF